jgi:hypothetical protein
MLALKKSFVLGGVMARIIVFLVVFCFLGICQAAAQPEFPTSRKVAAVFKSWEKIYTPDLCYPDAAVFKVEMTPESNIKALALKAAQSINASAKAVTSFKQLTSEEEVVAAANAALNQMGMSQDAVLAGQLYRVFQNAFKRQVFTMSVTNKNKDVELNGHAIVIADFENGELILLTYGESFDASTCEE